MKRTQWMPKCGPHDETESRPWQRAFGLLLFLGPFFFLSYNAANWWASSQQEVGSVVFGWERSIPFIAWTIIFYWLLDVLYALSLFICTSRRELDIQVRRLFTAQVIAVFCFFAFPLTFSFDRPDTTGVPGYLFALLSGFDKPYNQAPSLHIALLIIVWDRYLAHVPGAWKWLVHGVGTVIGVSVLTTYQHHFIDVPTGLLLGWFCIWLWPEGGMASPLCLKMVGSARRYRLAGWYLVGAIGVALPAFYLQGAALWLLWPAISLLVVAGCYALFGSAGFQKDEKGRLSRATWWLLWPYLCGVRLNSRLWTGNDAPADHIVDGVWVGRMPSRRDFSEHHFTTVIDVTAECGAPAVSVAWHVVPMLDLVTPPAHSLAKAAGLIERCRRDGPVLVVCALGYSRSAMAVITWLVVTGRAGDVQQAVAMVRAIRPRIVIHGHSYPAIEAAIELRNE